MNKFPLLAVLCAGFLFCMACTTDENEINNDNEGAPLSRAIQVVDNNPKEALTILAKILDPDLLYATDQNQYWQYVVILTQARYMDYQDITGDSLILDAQRYFAETKNDEMAARASYYAAAYLHEGEADDKAAEYWQAAFSFAKQAGDNLFMAKSAHRIAASYYNQDQWEDAMIYCQKALDSYSKESSMEYYKLDVTEMLGQIYRRQQDWEQASRYFDDGLKVAKNLNNTKYESRFLRNKGIIHWEKKEYPKAKEYFELALKQPEPEDQLRIYLSYAKLYEDMNRSDSALYYLKLIEGQIPEITYANTRRDIFKELATYYQLNEANVNKAIHYLQLAYTEDSRIKKSQTENKINALHLKFKELNKKKQAEWQVYQRTLSYALIAVSILAFLLIVFAVRKYLLKEKYKQLRQKQISQAIDQQHFLLNGLRSLAKSTDELYQKELAYAGSPAWEQQLMLREEFMIRIAECIGENLERLHNGRKALSKFTNEDLSIIYLSQQRVLPDESIGWMLGHQGNKEQYIMHRKEQIRRIMTEARMRDRDVRMLLPFFR